MGLDFLQILAFTLNQNVGWSAQLGIFWKVLSYFTIKNPIINLGYGFFLAAFSLFAAILVFSLTVCGFVGYLFKSNSFPYVWPIKFVRVVFALLVGVFYISSLKVFLFSLSCTYSNPDSVSNFKVMLRDFPSHPCWEMPHFVVAVLGGIFSLLLALTGMGVALISFEPAILF